MRSPAFLSKAWFQRLSSSGNPESQKIEPQRCAFDLISCLRTAPTVAQGLENAFDLLTSRLEPEEAWLVSSGPLVPESDGNERAWYLLRRYKNGGSIPIPPEALEIIDVESLDCDVRHTARVRHFGEIGILARDGNHMMLWDEQSADIETFVLSSAVLLEVDLTYRRLLENLPFDLLSHLPRWELFQQESERRMARLDFDNSPATFMAIRIENLINIPIEQLRPVMLQIAEHLKSTVRPTDLIGQLDSQTFLIMLDGADRFAAAERADALCTRKDYAPLSSTQISLKIGLVTREAHSVDTLETFLERACLALYKTADSRSCWSFFHENA